jgi:hypothetical protein
MSSLQTRASNRAVQRLLAPERPAPQREEPRPLTFGRLTRAAAEAELRPGSFLTRAEIAVEPAAGGLQAIYDRSSSGTVGGLTVWDPPVAPSFDVRVEATRTGTHTREFRASIQQTQEARPGNHRAYYPGPGYHRIRTSEERPFFAHLNDDMSNLIRDGEQEHLNDAARAYELSYGTINQAIQEEAARTATTPMVSARSQEEVRHQAEAALAARLPCQLGSDTATKLSPGSWVRLYRELAEMSRRRDGAIGMHALQFTAAGRRRGLAVKEVGPSLNTAINQFSSERMIRFQACGGSASGGAGSGSASPPAEEAPAGR